MIREKTKSIRKSRFADRYFEHWTIYETKFRNRDARIPFSRWIILNSPPIVTEAATRGVLWKKGVLRNFPKLTPAKQVFSCEICWITKSTSFTEHLWTTAFVRIFGQINLQPQICGFFYRCIWPASIFLTLSWPRSLLHRNQSIDLLSKLMDWFLYYWDLRRERVKKNLSSLPLLNLLKKIIY